MARTVEEAVAADVEDTELALLLDEIAKLDDEANRLVDEAPVLDDGSTELVAELVDGSVVPELLEDTFMLELLDTFVLELDEILLEVPEVEDTFVELVEDALVELDLVLLTEDDFVELLGLVLLEETLVEELDLTDVLLVKSLVLELKLDALVGAVMLGMVEEDDVCVDDTTDEDEETPR